MTGELHLLANRALITSTFRYDTDIAGGDSLQVINIGDTDRPFCHKLCKNKIFDSSQSLTEYITVSSNHGIVIMHPDILITPSRIAESIGCTRKGLYLFMVSCEF
jgi:hypothetical protein